MQTEEVRIPIEFVTQTGMKRDFVWLPVIEDGKADLKQFPVLEAREEGGELVLKYETPENRCSPQLLSG